MKGVAVVAYGAVSPFGEGERAIRCAPVGAKAESAIRQDPTLASAGLLRPFVARADAKEDPSEDRAAALLARALSGCVRRLDRLRPAWRTGRVGLILGTSSGGMLSLERWLNGEEVSGGPLSASYFGPMTVAARSLKIELSPYVLVLGACASSTLAIGLATRELALGTCDLVLAGGFDAVSVFVAAGFEALGAVSRNIPPQPFRLHRDGMALGEGAAVLALERGGERTARAYVSGFAATTDAVHLTAPDRTGTGLLAAIEGALSDARTAPEEVSLISAHATATPYNDAAEAKAFARAGIVGAAHPMKAAIGHTLGAAGALEFLAAVSAMTRGVIPAAVGAGEVEPEALSLELPAATREAVVANLLKVSSAFGGANAALTATRRPRGAASPARDVYVSRAVHVQTPRSLEELAEATGQSIDRLSRVDRLTLFALDAVCTLREREPLPRGASGVIVGHTFATLETNARYHSRIVARGARYAEPRRFPYTSPNAVAGECALALGFTGPSFAVGAGLHGGVEALAVAVSLVRAGDTDRVVVVAPSDADDVARRWQDESGYSDRRAASGAVALLVTKEQGWGRVESAVTRSSALASAPFGLEALLALAIGQLPMNIEGGTPTGGGASIRVVPVDKMSEHENRADKLTADVG